MGDHLYIIIVAILVYQHTESSAMIGIAFASFYSGTVLGYVLLPLCNRRHPIRLMQITDVTGAVVLTVMPFLPISFLLTGNVLLGFLRSLNRPVAQRIIPKLVPADQTLALNAEFQTVATLSMIVGFIAGAGLVAIDRIHLMFWINAASFLLCAALMGTIKNHIKYVPSQHRRKAFYLSMPAVNREIGALLIPNSLAFGFMIAFNNQLVVLMAHFSSTTYYYVAAEFLMALGIALAAMVLRTMAPAWGLRLERGQLWAVFGIGVGVFYLAAASAPHVAVALIALGVAGVLDGVFTITQMQILHRNLGDDLMEQVFSFRFLARNISKIISTTLVGFLSSFYKIVTLEIITSLAIILTMMACYGMARRQTKRMEVAYGRG